MQGSSGAVLLNGFESVFGLFAQLLSFSTSDGVGLHLVELVHDAG